MELSPGTGSCSLAGGRYPERSDSFWNGSRNRFSLRPAHLSEGERVTAIMSNRAFLEAAYEQPSMVSGLTEEARAELKRRIAIEQQPEEAAYCDENEEAVKVVNAAITMVAAALQSATGFEGNDQAFEHWMTASSASVEREIEAERARANTSSSKQLLEERRRGCRGLELKMLNQEAVVPARKRARSYFQHS
jgi:hypothetical protein